MTRLDALFLNVSATGGLLQTQFSSRAETMPHEKLALGPVKMAQRWLLCFATRRGSVPYKPLEGTTFLTELLNGALATETDLFSAFITAAAQADQQLLAERLETDDPGETLRLATLARLVVEPDRLVMDVRLTTQSEQSVIGTVTIDAGG